MDSCHHRMDKQKNGFIRLRDWGASDRELRPVVEKLTVQFMRKHLALPTPMLTPTEAMEDYGARLRAQEVSTLRQVLCLLLHYTPVS
jgi:hypothetical protein